MLNKKLYSVLAHEDVKQKISDNTKGYTEKLYIVSNCYCYEDNLVIFCSRRATMLVYSHLVKDYTENLVQ